MSRKFLQNRRSFMLGAAGAGGAALLGTLPFGGLSRLERLARAEAPNRQHLICITAVDSGWDPQQNMAAIPGSELAGVNVDHWGAFDRDSEFTWRFRDEDLFNFQDPQGGNRSLGPVWRDSQMMDIMDKVAVWRGISAGGNHLVDNMLQHHGSPSLYTSSYAALIARHLAGDYQRDLHYVMTADAPTDICMGSGLMTHSSATPILIPTLDVFSRLTGPGGDILRPAQDTATGDAIAALTGDAAAQLKNASDKGVYQAMLQSLLTSRRISGTGIANSDEFKAIMAKYHDIAKDAVSRAVQAKRFPSFSSLSVDIFVDKTHAATYFPYALAEYLVTRDYSAVVVIRTPMGDHHTNNDAHYLNLLVSMACTRGLIQALHATPDPTRPGSSIGDCTGIVMETDFCRTHACEFDLAHLDDPGAGTSHGITSAVLFAGGMFKTGRVFGDVMGGPQGVYKDFKRSFGSALPVDPGSGLPATDGVIFSQASLLPTVLGAFRVRVPNEQVNENGPFVPIIKCA